VATVDGKKTGGRKKGSVNKTTAEMRGMFQKHCPKALEVMLKLLTSSENENIRLSAAKEIFDRGYGPPKQYVEHSGTGEKGAMQIELTESDAELQRRAAAMLEYIGVRTPTDNRS
jgi:hypothetical protein